MNSSFLKAHFLLPIFLVGLIVCPISAFQPFENFRAPINAEDIVVTPGDAWIATGGGLYHINRANGKRSFETETRLFPDLDLTALALDIGNTLWIGTKRGFLYERTSDGEQVVHNAYGASGWSITTIYPYGDYLLIAASKGLSLFSCKESKAVLNATRFGDLSEAEVNDVIVYEDTLYVGLEEGYAWLPLDSIPLLQYNFYDNTIWHTVQTEDPVNCFAVSDTGLVIASQLTVYQDSTVYWVDTTTIQRNSDSIPAQYFDSDVRSLVFDERGIAWVGTASDYLYTWDPRGREKIPYVAPGPTFNGYERVHVAKDGRVWMMPALSVDPRKTSGYKVPWYKLIAAYDNGTWTQYRTKKTGWLGGGGLPYFRGFCEDHNGDLWFATYGNDEIYHNVDADTWTGFPSGLGMGMAIVEDSSGYMWWGASYSPKGAVVCLHPKNRGPLLPLPADEAFNKYDYRDMDSSYWFPPGTNYMQNINTMHVDQTGRIFMGGLGGNDDPARIIQFTYYGNPIDGQNASLRSVQKYPADYGHVGGMVSSPDTTTWIATATGLHFFDYKSQTINKFEPIGQELTCVEAENEYILWLGTSDDGLIRLSLLDTTKTFYTFNDGLVDDAVTDLSLDRKNGYLWVATTNGLSRMDLGHSFEKIVDNKETKAFPNPFSLARHKTISFHNIKSVSRVFIVHPDGNILAEVPALVKNAYGWIFEWEPPDTIAPGTYFYIVRSDEVGTIGKLLIIP